MQYKIYLHIKYVDYFALLSMYRIGTLYDYCVADQTAGHVSIYTDTCILTDTMMTHFNKT